MNNSNKENNWLCNNCNKLLGRVIQNKLYIKFKDLFLEISSIKTVKGEHYTEVKTRCVKCGQEQILRLPPRQRDVMANIESLKNDGWTVIIRK